MSGKNSPLNIGYTAGIETTKIAPLCGLKKVYDG
jgi:hypothetical protein